MDSERRGEMVPTEDVLNSLLEYFVDPILPLKACTKDPPISNQQSVAKQMQAVVLLYNYYCRKQHRLLQHLEFESFCQLAVTLKPALLSYMKFMQQGANTRSDEFESQFSITEKVIRDACNTCLALDASRDIPGTEGLPVSKVAVLLVDAKEENCHLLFSSLTNGAWSVIERSVETSSLDLKSSCRQKTENKRRLVEIEKLTDEQSNEELIYRMAAFTAVQETTGINQSDLVVLEGHAVNSISNANKAAFFYIMQCNSQINEGFQVPIKDGIESLQGSLLKKISGSWTLTPMVEYYIVLPYARIITDWLISKRQKADTEDSGGICSFNAFKSKTSNVPIKVCCHQRKKSSSESNARISAGSIRMEVDTAQCMISHSNQCQTGKLDADGKKNVSLSAPDEIQITMSEVVPSVPDARCVENMRDTLSRTENAITQIALRALFRKRADLCCQLRNIEDKIASCDRDINKIMEGDDHAENETKGYGPT